MDTRPQTACEPAVREGEQSPSRSRRPARWLALLLLPALLIGCGRNDGISRADADAILAQIQEVGARLDTVEQRLTQLGQADDAPSAQLISEVRAVGADVGEAKALLDEVGDQLAPAATEAGDAFDDPLNDPLNDPFSDPLDRPLDEPSDSGRDGAPDSTFDGESRDLDAPLMPDPDPLDPGTLDRDGL